VLFQLPDESTQTPEQEVLDKELRSRLAEAINHLPARDRALLKLICSEGLSIREAGRRLGWEKSSADRHYHAALDRMRPFFSDF